MVTDSDQQTMGTFKTWATNWTDCTNATFSKVHRYWSSNSALHKEVTFFNDLQVKIGWIDSGLLLKPAEFL